GQQIHLLRRLDRHELHGRSLHRFRDCLGVAVVVLVSLEERLHVLRRDQTHIVTKSCNLSCDKMRAGTGFHPDQAARDVAEPPSKLMRRVTFCRRTIAPRLSNPTKWNVFLPTSIPIVLMASGVF